MFIDCILSISAILIAFMYLLVSFQAFVSRSSLTERIDI